MQTVAQPTVAPKVFYAHFHDQAGMLGTVNQTIVFIADDSHEMTVIEPEDCTWLVALGEVGMADAQAAHDRIAGGAAWIATHRAQEVA
jgi:hypothetical protein